MRAQVACEGCRGRKKRCDGQVHGFPCTNCNLDKQPCRQATNRMREKGLGFHCTLSNKSRGRDHEATLDLQQITSGK